MAEPTLSDSGPHNCDSGGSMFREASGININGGTFNVYGSGASDEKAKEKENEREKEKEREKEREKEKEKIADAMSLIGSRAEQGAPYDAAAREDVPKCHEHTRVAIIDGIHIWAHSQKPNARRFMWMYGPAGSGKTTIMQTVAETFDKEGSLATSFFFSRVAAARPKDKKNFVITLAHQLSLCIPALQQPLADALLDLSILTKSLVKQLNTLIIGPLSKLDPAQIDPRFIFMVDGLDECDGDNAQRDILDLLALLLHQSPHSVRILIASRPLSHLQTFFSQGGISEITQTIPLDDNYQSNADITKFLTAQFEKIRREHPSRGGLPSEWPSPSDIGVLVKRASGQFIYASVVMKFISNHSRHPVESLHAIISLNADSGARPYEELDAVYAQVLSTVEPHNVEFVQTLMGCLLLDTVKFYFAHAVQTYATTAVDSIFMVQPGTTDARINRIYPLITASSEGMKFTHASFPEYLLDRSRSKEFFLDLPKVHCRLARHWFKSYSAHFERHPHGGIVPGNAAEYLSNQHDESIDRILFNMVRHCRESEWAFELSQDVLTFDVQAALKATPEWVAANGGQILWYGTVVWLDFIFWLEEHHRLSSAEGEHIRARIKALIQTVYFGGSSPPPTMSLFAALLTWCDHIDVAFCWRNMCDIMSVKPLVMHMDANHMIRTQVYNLDAHLCDASLSWLVKTLSGDIEMNGLFFADGQLYTDVALLLAQTPVPSNAPRGWVYSIVFMLSRALPSKELGTLLVQNFLPFRRNHFYKADNEDIRRFFMAILIYLFECGIPFLPAHCHGPEFDHLEWICGICLFFDPLGVDCADIELSQDPTVKPGPQPAQIAEADDPQPPQANPVRQVIPGFPVLWLQIWVFWLADMVSRFFPVVA